MRAEGDEAPAGVVGETRVYRPEVVVDSESARALVREQFGLSAASVEIVAAGWDYTVCRIDSEWAFRFPRREVVVEPLRRELQVLPTLAPLLPVQVPTPVFLGAPGDRFPWPFYGSRWLPGGEAAEASDRRALAVQLARFLRALHATDLPSLPVDVVGRGDMTLRVPRTRDELVACAGEGLWQPPPEVEELLARAGRLPPPQRLTVCHGDLHFRQVLVDGPQLIGVVDWVDVCRSDPGIDLQLAFAFLPHEARDAFFDEYGPVTDASVLRARVLALFLSAVLARYGRAERNGPVEGEAVASLDRAVAGL
jgi:aminoglycoside phosphotransferase (APT) family kinase protein